MADVKIRVFKGGEAQPETTVTIPGSVLNVASKLIPKQAVAALQDKGIDLGVDQALAEPRGAGDACRGRGTQEERENRNFTGVA